MDSAARSPNSVRKLLMTALPTDGDFDAFVLDFFPNVHQRFASGLTRIEKTNLLFQCVPEGEVIVDRLRQFISPESADIHKARLSPRISGANKLLLGLAVALLIATGVALSQRAKSQVATPAALRPTTAVPANELPPAQPASLQPVFMGPAKGNFIVNSPGAKIHNQL